MTSAHAPDDRRAAAELAFMVLLAAAIGGAAMYFRGRPAESAELRIPVAELRSQAAELALLERDLEGGKLDCQFAEQQAAQLSRISAVSYRELSGMHVIPELAERQANAVAIGRELERGIGALRASPPAELPDFDGLADRLQHIERALQP